MEARLGRATYEDGYWHITFDPPLYWVLPTRFVFAIEVDQGGRVVSWITSSR